MVFNVGEYEQYLYAKFRQFNGDFEEDLERHVKHSLKSEVAKLYLVRPTPSPRLGMKDFKAWEVY